MTTGGIIIACIIAALAVALLLMALWRDEYDEYDRDELLNWDWCDVWDELPPAPDLIAPKPPFDLEKE